ncbi:MAG: hypothetical protein GY906_18990 [bacterium]|nr:hypothetical protein [bacterium]
MSFNQPRFRVRSQGGFGSFSGSPPPRDLLILLGVIFVTFSLQFFAASAGFIQLVRLSPSVLSGFVWQVITYPFVGYGGASLWFLLELLILYWFGRDVFYRLGRKGFWRFLLTTTIVAGCVGVIAEFVIRLAAPSLASPYAFHLMQGQTALVTVMIAAFATLYGNASILLFFVIPIKARWFLWLEVLFLFFGFLNAKDYPGFIGGCASVFIAFALLTPGGIGPVLRKWRLRLEQLVLQAKLSGRRRRRKFDVIDGDGGNGKDRWVH